MNDYKNRSFSILICGLAVVAGSFWWGNQRGTSAYSARENDDASKVEQLLARGSEITSVSERMEFFSRELLETRFVWGPLGEGATGRFDQDPLYRLDAVDCVTFVETVAALAVSSGLSEFEKNINQIRYQDGEVSFLTRNHFPSSDWIPNNIQPEKGFFEDATATVLDLKSVQSKASYLPAKAVISKKGWYQSKKASSLELLETLDERETQERLEALVALGNQFPEDEEVELDYIPFNEIFIGTQPVSDEQVRLHEQKIEELEAQQKKELSSIESGSEEEVASAAKKIKRWYKYRIKRENARHRLETLVLQDQGFRFSPENLPSGTVVSIVAPNRDLTKFAGTHMNVTHQGLLVWVNGRPVFRHATWDPPLKVMDVPFFEYIAVYMSNPEKEVRKGIHFMRLKPSN